MPYHTMNMAAFMPIRAHFHSVGYKKHGSPGYPAILLLCILPYHLRSCPILLLLLTTTTMLLANTAVLAAILLPLASAKCYNNGPVFVNKQFGLDNVYNTAIMLQGELQSGQVRGTCVTDKNGGYNWYFSVRNVGKSGQTLDKNKIDGYLRAEIHNCGLKGGYTKHDWIEYK